MKKTLLSSVALATMLAFSPAFAGTVQLSADQMDAVTAGNSGKHHRGAAHGLKINQQAVATATATATAEGGDCRGVCAAVFAPGNKGKIDIKDSTVAGGAAAVSISTAKAAAANLVRGSLKK